MPARLRFNLGSCPVATVVVGDEVVAGQPLGRPAGATRSPVAGKVVAVDLGPDVRGGKPGLGVSITPAAMATPSLPALDPATASVAEIVDRWAVLGVTDGDGGLLAARFDTPVDVVTVLAVDGEPALCGAAQLARERWADVAVAARMLARVAGGARAVVAVAAPMVAELGRSEVAVERVAIPAIYPESLAPMVKARIGGGVVIPLEAGLAGLDAVAGIIPTTKVVTVIEGRVAVKNYRVALGTTIREVFAAAGLEPGSGDRVVAGGPLRGLAQYSLDAPVDATVDGLVHLRAAEVVKWSDEPCINCGACIDVCPRRLQVQLIGRYAEFGLFERTPELFLSACIDCGLCATVCTARRPLLQLIRLAKHELGLDRAPVQPNGHGDPR